MQTLGLADAGERSDGRLKSLFWPSVQSGADVDYLGAQGYWICAFIAVVSFGFSLLQGRPFLAITLLLFFYFGGVGVRQRDASRDRHSVNGLNAERPERRQQKRRERKQCCNNGRRVDREPEHPLSE